jgi:hypothetical protein
LNPRILEAEHRNFMSKFSTNNLLDKEEKKSRYAGLQVDQLDLKKEKSERSVEGRGPHKRLRF